MDKTPTDKESLDKSFIHFFLRKGPELTPLEKAKEHALQWQKDCLHSLPLVSLSKTHPLQLLEQSSFLEARGLHIMSFPAASIPLSHFRLSIAQVL